MPPVFVTLAEVVEIHRDQIDRYGGLHGIRDIGLLDSALAMPRSGVKGEYLHGDPCAMAAAYLFHIAKNHPFVDGNKRVGAATALVFLELNGIDVVVRNDDLHSVAMATAAGRWSKDAIADFLRTHVRG